MLIYRITNTVNSKSYVGLTSRSVRQRWTEHQRATRKGSNLPLHNAFRKYGPDSFTIEVIEKCDSLELLREREQHWIRELGTFGGGYNATAGGDGSTGHAVTDEHKKILSEAHQGNQHAKGYRHSDEARKRIGETSKARDAIGSKTRGKKLSKLQVDRSRRGHFKPVVQCDLEWNAISVFEGTIVAAKTMTNNVKNGKSGIGRCCKEPQRTAFGYRWRIATQNDVLMAIENSIYIQER